jgi:long-chain acyl-CoA synthetase
VVRFGAVWLYFLRYIMTGSLYNQFLQTTKRYGRSVAVRYEGKSWNYGKLNREILKMAGKLQTLGIHKGDVVAILLPNCFASLTLFYATSALGAIAYLIHPFTPAEELHQYIEKSHPKAVVLLDEEANELVSVLKREDVIFLAADPFDGVSHLKKLCYRGLHRLNKNIRPLSKIHSQTITPNEGADEDVALYLNTGGTNGEPKIVELQNGSLNRLGLKGYPLIGGEVTAIKILTAIPLCHGFGLAMGIHTPLSNGASTVLMNKFRTKQAISLLHKGEATAILGVPALYNAILSKDAFYGPWLKKQIIAFVGGDSVPESLLARYNETMEKYHSEARLYQGYGLTEAVNVANVNTAKEHCFGSVGKPLPGLSEIIVDPTSKKPLPPLSHGEIAIAGDTLMKGYLGDTSDPFISIEDKRYVLTGDYGYLNEEGYLFFEQRLRRIVKVKGETICPSAIEKAALYFYEIYEAYAYGVKDERNGATIHLALALRHGYEDTDKALLLESLSTRLKSLLPPNALPSHIYFLKELPKTAIGKIDDAKMATLDQ